MPASIPGPRNRGDNELNTNYYLVDIRQGLPRKSKMKRREW